MNFGFHGAGFGSHGACQQSIPGWVSDKFGALAAAVLADYDYAGDRYYFAGRGTAPFSRFHAVTRAGAAWAEDASGVLQAYGDGVARRNSKGIWLFDQAVEQVRNSAGVGGANGVWPTNWSSLQGVGITVTPLGGGTENGRPYFDIRVSGTATAAAFPAVYFEAQNQIAAANGQTWGQSFGAKVIAGSIANFNNFYVSLCENDATPVRLIEDDTAFVPTATYARYKQVKTLSGGATVAFVVPRFLATVSSGATVDITLRIYNPNCRQAPHMASEVITTGAGLTVNADTIQFAADALPLRADQGAQYFEFFGAPLIPGVNKYLTNLNAGNGNNQLLAFLVSTNNQPQILLTSGGTNQASMASTPNYPAEDTADRYVGSHVFNTVKLKSAGNQIVTDVVATMPAAFTQGTIGNSNGIGQLNKAIARYTTFSRPLSDAEMTTLAP